MKCYIQTNEQWLYLYRCILKSCVTDGKSLAYMFESCVTDRISVACILKSCVTDGISAGQTD